MLKGADLNRRVVFDDAERVAQILRAGGFAAEADDVSGKTLREIAWRCGGTARGRKTVLELLDAALRDEAA